MREQQVEEDKSVQPLVDIEEGDVFGLGDEHVTDVREHLRDGNEDAVRDLFEELHYADAADVVQQLKPEDRTKVLQIVGDDLEPEVWSELDQDILEEVVEDIGADTVAKALTEMDSDDALAVIEELDEELATVYFITNVKNAPEPRRKIRALIVGSCIDAHLLDPVHKLAHAAGKFSRGDLALLTKF